MNEELLLKASAVSKSYQSATKRIDVLQQLDLEIPARSMIAIMGASGVGKSTLLHVLGALDQPDSGEIFFEGQSMAAFTPEQLAEYRNQKIGFVFQMHHLLPEFNALENTMIPYLLRKYDKPAASQRAMQLLKEVGLQERYDHRPGQLSGGEQQRVAIARALMQSPLLILADEPTGNLDENTSASIFDLFRTLHAQHNLSFVIATHNPDLASICEVTYVLHEGKLVKR
ncbi:MAG: lipoprotein-releasing system ATP-binding protein LolD [Acidobacteria bacterium]|nr:MAG: lipoprotein-releasing system ATP-binding protein LolD [Acidobacteriota bacterium]